jgi:hypothetical protein
MINENLPPFSVASVPFKQEFVNNLHRYEFNIGFKSEQYEIYYRVYSKLPWIYRTQTSIIFLVLSKDINLSIDDKKLDEHLQQIKKTLSSEKTIQNELMLLFFDVGEWNDLVKEKAQQIIHFVYQNRAMVIITEMVLNKKLVYALRPQKLFPSKFYYVLIKLLYYLTDASEML